MVFWSACLGGLAVAYLLGSLPTGYLAGRLVKGIDLRRHGSGSTGATNVLRLVGKVPALIVLVIDLLKGVAAVLLALWLLPWLARQGAASPDGLSLQSLTPWAVCLAGLAALIGHSRSVWLGFEGGKSAATGLGVLLAMSWPVALAAAAVVAATLATLRIMSLSSMLGALAATILVFVLAHPAPYRLLVVAGALYVVWLHRANLKRLLAGTEPRLGQSSPS